MIHSSVNNSEIYVLLEKNEQMLVDFSIDKVIAFDEEDDFHIVIYSAESRNFLLFTAKECVHDTNAFPELINCLQEYSDSSFHSSLLAYALKLSENRMHSKNISRFFFDAH